MSAYPGPLTYCGVEFLCTKLRRKGTDVSHPFMIHGGAECKSGLRIELGLGLGLGVTGGAAPGWYHRKVFYGRES